VELLVVAWLAVGLVLVGRFVEKRLTRRAEVVAPRAEEPMPPRPSTPPSSPRSEQATDEATLRALASIAQTLHEERAIEAARELVRELSSAARVEWWSHDRSRNAWTGRSHDGLVADAAQDAALTLALRQRATVRAETHASARDALRAIGADAIVPVFDRALTVGALVVHEAATGVGTSTALRCDVVGAVLGVAIANARLSKQQLERQVKDPLTGLASVETLVQTVSRCLARGRVAVVLIAMPQMRAINLSYGRQAGDRTLAAVARLVALEAGEQAEVGRFGGATLLVVLPGYDAAAAGRVVTRLVDRVGDTLRAGPHRTDEPLCLEAVVADGEGGDAETLLRAVESRLNREHAPEPRSEET
jgi:diguanylate cyclase (GGDEF)-like protein